MQIRIKRIITVEYLFTDDPDHEEGNRFDDLSQYPTESILRDETRMNLGTLFNNTEMDSIENEVSLEVVDPAIPLRGKGNMFL